MRAAQIPEYGHADVVRIDEVDLPPPAAGQVRIEVHASSINPVDTALREGYLAQMAPIELSATPGIDVAGTVAALGEGFSALVVGDRVYGSASILAGGTGAFAEYASAPASLLAPMPANASFAEAGAIVLTGVSAVQALTGHLELQPGQKILVHGGAGGIGSLAIQLAKHLGAYVAATASGDGLELVRELGADEAIDYKNEAFDQRLTDYDAVLDTVGGETYTRSFRVLRPGGIIVSMLAPPNAELMEQYGVRAISQQTQVNTEVLTALAKLVEEGVLTPVIDRAFPLDEVREAFEAKEQGGVQGKIGIQVRP